MRARRSGRQGMRRTPLLGIATWACVSVACREHKTLIPDPPMVVVTPALERDVPVSREWIGTTAGDIDARIRPRIEGYLLRRAYGEGGFVRAGDLLFEIDPRQLEAQLAQSQASLAQATAD